MDRWEEAEKALKIRDAREREIQINGLSQAFAIWSHQNPTLLGTQQMADFAKAIDDRIAAIRGGSRESKRPATRPAPAHV